MTDTSPEIAAMVRSRIMARSGSERFERNQRLFQRFQGSSISKYIAEQQISENESQAKAWPINPKSSTPLAPSFTRRHNSSSFGK